MRRTQFARYIRATEIRPGVVCSFLNKLQAGKIKLGKNIAWYRGVRSLPQRLQPRGPRFDFSSAYQAMRSDGLGAVTSQRLVKSRTQNSDRQTTLCGRVEVCTSNIMRWMRKQVLKAERINKLNISFENRCMLHQIKSTNRGLKR